MSILELKITFEFQTKEEYYDFIIIHKSISPDLPITFLILDNKLFSFAISLYFC